MGERMRRGRGRGKEGGIWMFFTCICNEYSDLVERKNERTKERTNEVYSDFLILITYMVLGFSRAFHPPRLQKNNVNQQQQAAQDSRDSE